MGHHKTDPKILQKQIISSKKVKSLRPKRSNHFVQKEFHLQGSSASTPLWMSRKEEREKSWCNAKTVASSISIGISFLLREKRIPLNSEELEIGLAAGGAGERGQRSLPFAKDKRAASPSQLSTTSRTKGCCPHRGARRPGQSFKRAPYKCTHACTIPGMQHTPHTPTMIMAKRSKNPKVVLQSHWRTVADNNVLFTRSKKSVGLSYRTASSPRISETP